MLSPNINIVLKGLGSYKEGGIYASNNEPMVSVNNLTGKVGTLYEKMRYLVDYKEEHSIRRNAIERILKRNILMEDNSEIGLSLLRELVSSGYLPDKSVPESVAGKIQLIANKYLILGIACGIEKKRVVSLMASEIERFLFPQLINDLVLDWFYSTISVGINYSEKIPVEELNIQTYIACRHSFLQDDRETLLYAVLIKNLPELPKIIDETEIKNIALRFSEILTASEKDIKDPLAWKISSKLKNYSVYFSVLKEIVEKYGLVSESLFNDKARLAEEIKKILEDKYKRHGDIISKSGTRAIEYILLTKIGLAFLLELPYEKIFLASVDYFALGVNVIFHPLLLFLMVKTIRPPSLGNTSLIVSGINSIVENEDIKTIHIKSSSDGIFMQIVFGLLYFALCTISFGLIFGILKTLNFSIISMFLFLLFLTLVSYFGFRIRHNARKWIIYIEDDRILTLLWNFFTFPIINVGRWLSRKFSSINIFVFALDIILETPFKLILSTFDSFIYFLKEKGEDSY